MLRSGLLGFPGDILARAPFDGALGRPVVPIDLQNGDRPGLALHHHDVDRADVVGLGIGQLPKVYSEISSDTCRPW